LRLVAVAALICAAACGSAFGFHRRSLRTRDAARWAWAGLTGLVAGCGVWATHFMAMLAYQPSLPIQYDGLTGQRAPRDAPAAPHGGPHRRLTGLI
jgi:NO-binding membrane sensor protein with MHYT domain